MGQADRGLVGILPVSFRFGPFLILRGTPPVPGQGSWSLERETGLYISKDLQETLRPLLCGQVSSHRTQSLVIVGRSSQGSRLFKGGRGVLESGRNLLEPQRGCRQRADFRDLDLRSALVGFILEKGFVN